MGYYKHMATARRGKLPPSWLLAEAERCRRLMGGRGYDEVRRAALDSGATPFQAMVAWQMAQGRSLEAATRIAAYIARNKRR